MTTTQISAEPMSNFENSENEPTTIFESSQFIFYDGKIDSETETISKTDTTFKSETINESEIITESETPFETETFSESETISESETPFETETISESKTISESETNSESESNFEPYTIFETVPLSETDTITERETVFETTEEAAQTDTTLLKDFEEYEVTESNVNTEFLTSRDDETWTETILPDYPE